MSLLVSPAASSFGHAVFLFHGFCTKISVGKFAGPWLMTCSILIENFGPLEHRVRGFQTGALYAFTRESPLHDFIGADQFILHAGVDLNFTAFQGDAPP